MRKGKEAMAGVVSRRNTVFKGWMRERQIGTQRPSEGDTQKRWHCGERTNGTPAALALLHLCVSLSPHISASLSSFLLHRVIPGGLWSAMAPYRASCPGETFPAPSPTDPASTPTSANSLSGSRTPSSRTHEASQDPTFWCAPPSAVLTPARTMTLSPASPQDSWNQGPPFPSPGLTLSFQSGPRGSFPEEPRCGPPLSFPHASFHSPRGYPCSAALTQIWSQK